MRRALTALGIIAALGLAIAGLSLTGAYIWWRKRRARHWNGR